MTFSRQGSQGRDAYHGEQGPLTVRMLSGYCKITESTKYRKSKGVGFRTGLNLMMILFHSSIQRLLSNGLQDTWIVRYE